MTRLTFDQLYDLLMIRHQSVHERTRRTIEKVVLSAKISIDELGAEEPGAACVKCPGCGGWRGVTDEHKPFYKCSDCKSEFKLEWEAFKQHELVNAPIAPEIRAEAEQVLAQTQLPKTRILPGPGHGPILPTLPVPEPTAP